jgi:hypothetical protein
MSKVRGWPGSMALVRRDGRRQGSNHRERNDSVPRGFDSVWPARASSSHTKPNLSTSSHRFSRGLAKVCNFEQTGGKAFRQNVRHPKDSRSQCTRKSQYRTGPEIRRCDASAAVARKYTRLQKGTMNNIGRTAEPNPELVECAIVEVLNIAERHGITAADFVRLLDSGMQMSDFLTAVDAFIRADGTRGRNFS